MNILCVADEEEKSLWDYYTPDSLREVDLIVSCGDLHPDYLQFLVTMGNCPLLYVYGNHDQTYDRNPPWGCECIEDRIYNFDGLRVLGLGGSMRYKPGKNMYTEKEMRRRIARLSANLTMTNGFDVLVTHSPALGYGDLEDLPHKGFACFNDLLEKYHPKYMFHGHVHKAYGHFLRERLHPSGTMMINACGRCTVEISDADYPPRGKTGSVLYDLYTLLQRS